MTLRLLGGQGAVGRRLLEQARARGDAVVMALPPPGQAGGTRPEDIDAGAWAAEDGPRLPPADFTREVGRVTEWLRRMGPVRLVFLSWLGAIESRRQAGLVAAVVLARLFRGPSLHEAEAQERCIRDSTLAWTIVRPGVL